MEELSEYAVAAKEQEPRFCADKGRQDERERAQRLEQVGMGQFVTRGQEGKGNTNDDREQGRQGTEEETVPQATAVELGGEHAEVVIPRELTRLGGKETGLEDGAHRVHHQEDQHQDRHDENDVPYGKEAESAHLRTVTGLSGAKDRATASPGFSMWARFTEEVSTRRVRSRAST